MGFIISQIMFFTNPKLAVFLSLVAVLLIDKILEMIIGALSGILIFSHIQEIVKKKVEEEYEPKSSS